MLNETIKVTGEVFIKLFDENGTLKGERHIKNLVVDAGKAFIASRMTGTSAAVMSHMAVGTNNTAAAAGNTTLNTELARVALASSVVSTNTVTYNASFPAGTGTGSLVEAGIFNAGSSGTMLCRTTFGTLTKAAGDVVTVAWVVTIS